MRVLGLNLVLSAIWAALQGTVDLGNLITGFVFGYLILWFARPAFGGTRYFDKVPATLGFLLFFTLGLGMGAVFFAAVSLNLLVRTRLPGEKGKMSLARIKVPTSNGVPRFLQLPERHHFVALEDVAKHNLDLLLPEMEIASCYMFRLTRNANTERDGEKADDLLAMIESELRDRRFAPIVRLQIQGDMDETSPGMLSAEFGLDEQADVFSAEENMLAMRDLFQLSAIERPDLHDAPHHPVDHPMLQSNRSIFYVIRDQGPFLLHHPYESFATSVERFLKEASQDPKVHAIKMTLYRTSEDSKIVDYLISAAQNGKQVAVVVELQARFDEAANIRWASRLEEAGIHVTYGVIGLKNHCKVILVVRQDFNGFNADLRYNYPFEELFGIVPTVGVLFEF